MRWAPHHTNTDRMDLLVALPLRCAISHPSSFTHPHIHITQRRHIVGWWYAIRDECMFLLLNGLHVKTKCRRKAKWPSPCLNATLRRVSHITNCCWRPSRQRTVSWEAAFKWIIFNDRYSSKMMVRMVGWASDGRNFSLKLTHQW